jgi:hypothetical protein
MTPKHIWHASQQPALLIRPASRCGLLQFIHLMEPNDLINTTGQPVRLALILNVTAWPNQPDIIRFGPYRPHEFVLGDHAWPQNASDKSTTNTTNKARDQILTRQCGLLHRVYIGPSLRKNRGMTDSTWPGQKPRSTEMKHGSRTHWFFWKKIGQNMVSFIIF